MKIAYAILAQFLLRARAFLSLFAEQKFFKIFQIPLDAALKKIRLVHVRQASLTHKEEIEMKGEALVYDFGYGEVDSYRWINADGRTGGIVAASAMVADSASIGEGAAISPGAIIGEGAVIGDMTFIGEGAVIGEGAFLGYGASIGAFARVGSYASIGFRASLGPDAIIGDDADIDAADWHMAGACGSRGATWTAVHSRSHGLRWWVGCQRGISTEELLAAVQATHGDNAHARAYRHAVQCIVTHPEYLRRVAAQAE